MGQAEHGSAGQGGRDYPSSVVLGPMAGDPVSERPVTLVSATSASFYIRRSVEEKGEKGLLPWALALVSGMIGRLSALSLGCFLLPLTLH